MFIRLGYNSVMGNINTIKMPCRKFIILLSLIFFAFLSGCLNYTNPTPLNQAAWNNDVNQLKTLIDNGTPVDEVGTNSNGVRLATPLDTAIVQRNIEATKILLDKGADVNLYRFCCYNTPRGEYVFKGSVLMLACLIGDVQITEMLLSAGADINQLSKSDPRTPNTFIGRDAYFFSAEQGHVDIFRLLMRHGLDINKTYEDGYKPVYEALYKGNIDYIITLLENGLKIEPDIEWMHCSAEIAFLAAIYYAQNDEGRSLQFFNQAIDFYPQAAKNYEQIANSKELKQVWKMMFAAAATTFYYKADKQGYSTVKPMLTDSGEPGQYSGQYSLYYNFGNTVLPYIIDYNPDWTEKEFFRQKAEQSLKNLALCQDIVACYEENNPGTKLVDCIETTLNLSMN